MNVRSGGWIVWCALLLALWGSQPAAAQSQQPPPDAACRLCHTDSTGTMTLPSGEVLHAQVDPAVLEQSVHGLENAEPIYCTDCHGPRQRYQYPHTQSDASDRAQYRAGTALNCEQCHDTAAVHNPGHLQAATSSDLPNCVDCHGGHAVEPAAVLQADPVGTCQQCHQSYPDEQLARVHAEVAANFGPGQSCETCHASVPQSKDALCQSCHSLLAGDLTLASGEKVSLHVNPADLVRSVHGEQVREGIQYTTLNCTDCHQEQSLQSFPHPRLDAANRRALTSAMQQVCQECHLDVYENNAGGVHAQHIRDGQQEAATCTDCHGSHAIQDPDQPRERISQICGDCHEEIQRQYVGSVHGAALIGENNPDVPVCTDCHGSHAISDPTTAAFRLSSPRMCGQCHADATVMDKYGISTDVFSTYVADFHGTTVTLFERQSPDEETNKAVCYDCHGVHDILPATAENSTIIKANLLATCQQCHPGANENFPDSWTSHFRPSLEHNPLVYWVDLFYAVVIPLTLSGFFLFIGSDLFRRVREHFQRQRKEPEDV
ncbi:MAG: cytochrome c3 family protein [Caldilinea sp.]|jgi:predicted CXXCH cytochrome family protein|nr:cytochrome c3 family protein [Caldilinea sp.]